MAAAGRRARDREPDHASADDKDLHASGPLAFILDKNRVEGSTMADDVVRACAKSDVAPETVKAFAVGAKTLAIYNIDGTYYATDDECTHAAASLADGMLDGDVIECCMHMGSFRVRTGEVVSPPCEVPLRTYQVVLRGDDVFVDLTRNAAGEPE